MIVMGHLQLHFSRQHLEVLLNANGKEPSTFRYSLPETVKPDFWPIRLVYMSYANGATRAGWRNARGRAHNMHDMHCKQQ